LNGQLGYSPWTELEHIPVLPREAERIRASLTTASRKHDMHPLLTTPLVEVSDAEAARPATLCIIPDHNRGGAFVFPYRGAFTFSSVEGSAVVDAAHVACIDAGSSARVLMPVDASAAALVVCVSRAVLRDMSSVLHDAFLGEQNFPTTVLGIDPRAQVLVAVVRHSLRAGLADGLEAESLALTLVQRSIGPRTARSPGSTQHRRLLVGRAKRLLAQDLTRRWSLAEIAEKVGVSPVYLTQCFSEVESVPLYQYQLRLRLARSLTLLAEVEDLALLRSYLKIEI
jgi:AraC-like DNA-binding protein